MLSFIVRLCAVFQREHGFSANVVHVSAEHYQRLQSELAAIHGHAELRDHLGMEILVSDDVTHPHVGWLASAARLSVAS